ncbi:MAG: hypothetical protein H6Q52_459 [Deltaproteobacteria bacterium]|nr:hypothetical protein [Deltaproteobacteria bacterium]
MAAVPEQSKIHPSGMKPANHQWTIDFKWSFFSIFSGIFFCSVLMNFLDGVNTNLLALSLLALFIFVILPSFLIQI